MKPSQADQSIESLEAQQFSAYFDMLPRDTKGEISLMGLWSYLNKSGILSDDLRLIKLKEELQQIAADNPDKKGKLSQEYFDELVKNHVVLRKCFSRSLAIPEFENFCAELTEIFEVAKKNKGGKVADYIPQLSRVNPEHFAMSICTVDGQRFSIGDAKTNFCLQSSCKPINYCLAIEEHGAKIVHQHVGREPSGHSFNELSLNSQKLPHNPMINAGAIMSLSLLQRDKALFERFEHVSKTWEALCGNRPVYFNNSVYQSERETADRNFALAYFMREHQAFPENTNLTDTLEFYFQCCSIESCTSDLAVAAATLANAGANPLTGQKIFQESTVQYCMSLMLSCGMYDYSGEFAFRVGLPAKSGVSGVMLIVIPNVMGISIWSPRLDELGNSVRGIEFCQRLVEEYNFHNYDSLNRSSKKKNPRLKKYESQVTKVMSLIWAASTGDLEELIRLRAEGVNLSIADYDGRTALHLAAAENQVKVLQYLIDSGVELDPKDRWGGTPLSEAEREGFKEVADLLTKAINKRKKKSKVKVS